MDIVSQTIIQYSAYCSRCGAHGPHRPSTQTAALAALDEGWKELSLPEYTQFYYRTFCPKCLAKRKKDQ